MRPFTQAAHDQQPLEAFEYLHCVLTDISDAGVLLDMLRPRHEDSALKTLQERSNTLVHALINLRTAQYQQQLNSTYMDDRIHALVQAWSRTLPMDDYMAVSSMCRDMLYKARLNVTQASNRKERQSNKAYSASCLFIQKAFKRTRQKK
jgi:hypothetical protein